jgi:glc operon protein GlcG
MDETLILRGGITLSSRGADVLLAAAKTTANEMGIPMCIAVVDVGGSLLGFGRTDDARLGNIQMAITKAVSAVMRRRATAEELAIRPDDPTQTIRTTLAAGIDKVTAMSGGIPIFAEGQLIGGIGVSGGRGHEDVAVAQAAIEVLGVNSQIR